MGTWYPRHLDRDAATIRVAVETGAVEVTAEVIPGGCEVSGVWMLPLPFEVPYLSLNQTLHKAVKSQRIKAIRTCAREAALKAGVPHLGRFTVELHYIPKTRGRRDPENWVPTSKAVVDGLVLAGVAHDDSPEYFTPSLPVMDPPQGAMSLPESARFYAVVAALEDFHRCPAPGCDHGQETRRRE